MADARDGIAMVELEFTHDLINVLVETSLITKVGKIEKGLITEAAERFGSFLELPVSVLNKEHTNEQRKIRSFLV